MKDRLTLGFIAGVIGGVFMNLLDLILVYLFHWADVRYIDYTAIFIYGNKPSFWGDTLLALLIHLIFTGLLGIVFVYLLSAISNKSYLFKGGIFGVFAWFIFYLTGFLHRVPLFEKTTWPTAVSDVITSIAYGLILAETLRRLAVKYFDDGGWKGGITMRDRFTMGFIAGVAGGVVQVLIDYALEILHLGKIRYLDYAAITIWQ